MKKISFLLFLLLLLACTNKDVNNEKINNEVLNLLTIDKKDTATWYDNFSKYRENYKKFKVNSELVLGTGTYEGNPNLAYESAQKVGEENIRALLLLNNNNKKFGNEIDKVLEIYKRGEETLYRYILLLEVNKVSIVNEEANEKRFIEEARRKLEDNKGKAEGYIDKGDKLYLSKNYEEAIIAYEKALAIFQSNGLYKEGSLVEEKIGKVRNTMENEKISLNKEKIELNRKISNLENKKDKYIYDYEELLGLYILNKDNIRIKEIKEKIREIEVNEENFRRKNEIKNYIVSLVKEGYVEENYRFIFNKVNDYYISDVLDEEKILREIEENISNRELYILYKVNDYYSEESKIINQFIQDKNSNYLVRSGVYEEINKNDYYKYNSYKILYIDSYYLIGTKGNYGWFANFSLNAFFKDYEKKIEKKILYQNKRSSYTDYTSERSAIEGILGEVIGKI